MHRFSANIASSSKNRQMRHACIGNKSVLPPRRTKMDVRGLTNEDSCHLTCTMHIDVRFVRRDGGNN